MLTEVISICDHLLSGDSYENEACERHVIVMQHPEDHRVLLCCPAYECDDRAEAMEALPECDGRVVYLFSEDKLGHDHLLIALDFAVWHHQLDLVGLTRASRLNPARTQKLLAEFQRPKTRKPR